MCPAGWWLQGEAVFDRWRLTRLEDQVLAIADELKQAADLMGPTQDALRRSAYAHALELTDWTLASGHRPTLKRELSLWRGLLADLSDRGEPDPEENLKLLRVLLLFTFETGRSVSDLSHPST